MRVNPRVTWVFDEVPAKTHKRAHSSSYRRGIFGSGWISKWACWTCLMAWKGVHDTHEDVIS